VNEGVNIPLGDKVHPGGQVHPFGQDSSLGTNHVVKNWPPIETDPDFYGRCLSSRDWSIYISWLFKYKPVPELSTYWFYKKIVIFRQQWIKIAKNSDHHIDLTPGRFHFWRSVECWKKDWCLIAREGWNLTPVKMGSSVNPSSTAFAFVCSPFAVLHCHWFECLFNFSTDVASRCTKNEIGNNQKTHLFVLS
jgi:hypothetical protein